MKITQGILILILATCHVGVYSDNLTVLDYCRKFAEQYTVINGIEYTGDVSVVKRTDTVRHITNLFQPRDARFTAGYACSFQDVSVSLYLTGTRDFAEYTQWQDLQIIPIGYVTDDINGRAGYGVFKYLEVP